MTIYDPPGLGADRREWEAYLNSLSPRADGEEIERVSEFIRARFDSGVTLEEYAESHIFGE